MKSIFFCELPGMEITESCDTFEKAFRALNAYTVMVMDQYSDFNLMDLHIGIEENGERILLPKAMDRARSSGLMDKILTEETGSVVSDSILKNLLTEFANPQGELVLA